MNFKWLLGAFFFGMFLLGCDRMASTGRSNIVIQMPSASELQGKMSKSDVSSMSLVELQKLCFAVNMKGPGIKSTLASSCDIERGVFTDSTEPGGVITLEEVESGPDRTFELYAFRRDNVTDKCPKAPLEKLNWPLEKTYFLGKTSGVVIAPPETSVEIKYSIPSESQNIVVQNSWPVTCLGNNVSPSTVRMGRIVSTGQYQLTPMGYGVYSKISPLSDEKTLGTNYKIRNWKVSQ